MGKTLSSKWLWMALAMGMPILGVLALIRMLSNISDNVDLEDVLGAC